MSRKKWVFLGVALSIVWALVAGLRQHSEDVASATNFADFAYKTFVGSPGKSGPAGVQRCEQEREKNLATWMENDGKNVAFTALAPIPVGWLAGYILVMLWRIQVAGFRAVFGWGSLADDTLLKAVAFVGDTSSSTPTARRAAFP